MERSLFLFSALCVALLVPAPAFARPLPTRAAEGFSASLIKKDTAFDRSVPKSVRRSFRAAISSGPSVFRSMVNTVDGQLIVAMRSDKYMQGAAGITTWRTGPVKRPYRIYFSKEVDWDDFQARVVAAHELGHVLDSAGVSGSAMRRVFLAKAKRSSRWKKCFKKPSDPSRCMPLAEIFADHVAFYAVPGDFQSGYNIPRLLSDAQMKVVLRRMWKPHLAPGDVGGR